MEPITFYPKKSAKLGLFFSCAAFVAAGVWMAGRGEWMGYVCAGFFGLGMPLSLIQMLPGSTYLHLDADGFTFCSYYRKHFCEWRVIKLFYAATMRQNGIKVREMVGFDYIDDYGRSRFGRAFSRALGMAEGALPDTYGQKAADLAALMNQYRETAEVAQPPQFEISPSTRI